jgi:queuine tRNA-ribosyltransferase
MPFSLTGSCPGTEARLGTLALNHGTVETPCFMPVGTNATVKAMTARDLEQLGIRLILGNTYHLYLRPGPDVIRAAGGLHRFMGWQHNILTDSGGYQVFSLAPLRTIDAKGVTFKSHLDGSVRHLSPEEVVDLQALCYGSDVLMPLDVCTAPGIPRDEAEEAMRTTSRWLERSAARWREADPAMPKGELFGIMQGNFHRDLREQSARQIAALDLPGYAIGGLSVGEEFEVFRDFTHFTAGLLPRDRPRYLMGIGTPEYVLEAIDAGIDLFDCVFPTRTARNALALTLDGPLNLRLERNRDDFRPIEPECGCSTCRDHSRSYLRHLFKAREILAAMLATRHNLAFIGRLIADARLAVAQGRFPAFKAAFLERYRGGDPRGSRTAGTTPTLGEGTRG